MKKAKDKFFIGFMCIILGIVLAMQFRIVQGSYLEGAIPSQRALELESELKKIKEEKQHLLQEIQSYEKKLKEIEESASKDNVLIKNLNKELKKYKIIAGFESVKGPGIEVVVDDPPKTSEFGNDYSVASVKYDLLLSLINVLNSAGAEAISVNGQRIISTTGILYANNSVKINSVPTAPPFIIKAIGNPDTLESVLNFRFGIVWDMRENYLLQVNIRKLDEVVIPRYNDIVKFRYAKTINEK
ncbi:Uncharacterized conserved protein YlxW, UPF0749 family [Caminicella sporogenes DSM 14501]|uniref:Uncharacterized conserved protein YlxW, UPF0749 family n=1 Tax=Caminicella sporogenes DSM 14501 TaxID=1121266 RepID=A0A1M6L1R4_9FIRM|nr:DUF881 domain-containing protein [Caminicella sporogenes]RKD27674.1 hypothetical protein BET04_00995 [Caminicella sporogenes]WIF94749.1 DUF881 domain-containing protein [Caminicella sporogenes]SHJ65086.1 Uncharacterized conserved protein YlxW, UPF0749 family [Caminicella sporogenes DSM 14501]